VKITTVLIGVVLAVCIWATPSLGNECKIIGESAGQFMLLRQMDAPFEDVLEGALSVEGMTREAGIVIVNMITEAYAVPIQPTLEEKADVAQKFADAWEKFCVRVLFGKEI
jgi:hypothetical protein